MPIIMRGEKRSGEKASDKEMIRCNIQFTEKPQGSF